MITTKDDGTKVVHNGYGTTGGTTALIDREVHVRLSQNFHPLTIGCKEYVVNTNYEVVLTLCNVNSIDAMIDTLKTAKATLQSRAL